MKQKLLTFALSIFMMACSTTQVTQRQHNGKKKKARVTYYCAGEDRRWGSKTASGVRARAGTIAAERRFLFGTRFKIPALKRFFGFDDFVVQDRGSAVERRKASRGELPVIDVYVANRKTMRYLAAVVPPILEFE